jgi:hypothetical protein
MTSEYYSVHLIITVSIFQYHSIFLLRARDKIIIVEYLFILLDKYFGQLFLQDT